MAFLDETGLAELWSLIKAEDAKIATSDGNRNLLDNWYFLDPINTRGKTSYTGAYSIDRWRGGYASDTVQLVDGGVRFENKRASGYTYWRQYLDGYLPAGTYTLSVLVSQGSSADGIVYLCDNSGTAIGENLSVQQGLISKTITVGEGVCNRVQFTISNGRGVTVAAIKLERGERQTLARQNTDGSWVLDDLPPDKGLEFVKCMTSTADTGDVWANQSVGNARIALGSYTGTNTYGPSNQNSLTFEFEPKVVLLRTNAAFSDAHSILIRGAKYAQGHADDYLLQVAWSGNTVQWYDYSNTGLAQTQFNQSGCTYYYVAIG